MGSEFSDAGWLHWLNETHALTPPDRHDRVALLRQETRGVSIFSVPDRFEESAVARADGLAARWRRRIPGPWLVTRSPDGRWPRYLAWDLAGRHDDWVTAAHGHLSVGSVLEIGPRAALRAAVDQAGRQPMAEQLRAAGLDLVAADRLTPRTFHTDTRCREILVAHHTGAGTVGVTLADSLVVWDPTIVRKSEVVRASEIVAQVPNGHAGTFQGSIKDLVMFHPRFEDREISSSGGWKFPSPHFHTRDGAVVCAARNARDADESNVPWWHENHYVSAENL